MSQGKTCSIDLRKMEWTCYVEMDGHRKYWCPNSGSVLRPSKCEIESNNTFYVIQAPKLGLLEKVS